MSAAPIKIYPLGYRLVETYSTFALSVPMLTLRYVDIASWQRLLVTSDTWLVHVTQRFYDLPQQEAQLSQRGRATLRVIEYFAKSFKVVWNDTVE